MTEELQALLERINQKGIEEADKEKDRIIEEANTKAKQIVNDAKAEADRIVDDAQREAKLAEDKGRDQLKHAARDTLLSLRETLQNSMSAVIEQCLSRDVSPEAFAEAIVTFTKSFMQDDKSISSIEVLTSDKDQQVIRDYLLKALGNQLKEQPTVSPVRNISAGFRLSFNGNDVWYDFSDSALAEAITQFLNPQLSEIITSQVSENKSE